MNKFWHHKKTIGKLVIYGMIVVCMCIIACDLWVGSTGGTHVYQDLEKVPQREVALVLGTVKHLGPYINTFYEPRVTAAAQLYHAHKVRAIVVSGDNGREGYDEATTMKNDLIALGVDARHVTCDYAGFSTLDSVHRIKRVFQQDSYIVVSQKFHVERALYISQILGHDAVAFVADGPSGWRGFKIRMREVLARVKAVAENGIFSVGPKFLGDKELVVKR